MATTQEELISAAYEKGRKAYLCGLGRANNPYRSFMEGDLREAWFSGWIAEQHLEEDLQRRVKAVQLI